MLIKFPMPDSNTFVFKENQCHSLTLLLREHFILLKTTQNNLLRMLKLIYANVH